MRYHQTKRGGLQNRQTQKYKTSIDRSLKKNFFINFKDGENIYLTERQIQKSKTFQKKSINQKILNKLSNIANDILLTRTNLIKQVRILENKHNTQNKIVGLYDLNEVSYLELDAPQN